MITRRQFGAAALVSSAVAASGRATSGTRARVAPNLGAPTLYINDVPRDPYIYFFAEPVKEYIADFARAGIHLYSWGWSSIIAHSMEMGWKGPGRSDYSEFDSGLATILDADPDAYVFPRLAVSAPKWWLESHPDDRLAFEDGRPGTSTYSTSMASQAWLVDASAALVALIRHVDSMPIRDRIIGYQLTGGINEWFYTFDSRFADFSPAALRSFRTWLKARYRGDSAAFGKPGRFLRRTSRTRPYRRPTSGCKRMWTSCAIPPVRARVPDYLRFHSETNANALIHLCEAGKRATGGEKIFGAFYGYLIAQTSGYGGGHAPWNWGHTTCP